MIGTVMRINWLTLKRDKVAFVLAFVLPIVFFSFFGVIFGGNEEDSGTRPISTIIVDEDTSPFSAKFIESLKKNEALVFPTQPEEGPYTRETAKKAIQTGKAVVAVILPQKFGEGTLNAMVEAPPILVIHDSSNPVAQYSMSGILTGTTISAAPTMMMDKGMALLSQFGGGLTEQQKYAVNFAKESMTAEAASGDQKGLVNMTFEDAQKTDDEEGPKMVAYFGAGVGIMFMLFYMAGAGGSILEEEETGTLDRLLTSQLTMNKLLLGKWIFYAIMGYLQMYLMFVWASVVFGLPFFDLKTQLGFSILTIFAATGASAFGMLLAAVCKTRAQLSGISTIVIMMMSALGGSMVPRFVMPAFLDSTAKFTLNGWAIDGYLKIFWYKNPDHSLLESVLNLWPEITAMIVITIGFLGLSFHFAKRWSAQ